MLNIQVFPVNMVEENTYVVSDDTHEAAIIDCGALYAEERESILCWDANGQVILLALVWRYTSMNWKTISGRLRIWWLFCGEVCLSTSQLRCDCSKEEIQCRWENTNFVSSLPLGIRRGAVVSIVPKKRCYLPAIVCFVPTSAVATFPEEISKV